MIKLITDLFTKHLDINIHFKHYQNNNVFNYIKHLITFNLTIQLDTVKKYLIHVFNYFNEYNLSTNDNRSFYDYGFNNDEFWIFFSYIKNNITIWNKANKILFNICYELISKFKDYPIRFKVGLFVFGVNEKVNGFDEKFYNDIEQTIIKDLKTIPLFEIFNQIVNLQYFDNKINKNIKFTNAFCKFIIDNFYQQMDIYNNLFIKSLKTFKDSILSQNIKIYYKNPFYVLSNLNRKLIKINNNIMKIERLISTNANIDYTNEHDSYAITLFIKLDLTKDKMAYIGYNSNSIYENEIIIKPGRFRIINKLNKFVYEIEPVNNKI